MTNHTDRDISLERELSQEEIENLANFFDVLIEIDQSQKLLSKEEKNENAEGTVGYKY